MTNKVWNANVITPEARRVAETRYTFAQECRANVQMGKPVAKLRRAKADGDQNILRKCKVFCELGRGAYGRVLKVLYEGKVACLKRAHADFAKISFEAEVRALRRLDGKGGAPRVYDAADDSSGFVMDCFPGDSFFDLLNRHPYADALSYLRIYLAIAKSLREVHAAGIVHQDYKSDNVIVRRDPSGEFVVRLIDFGLASEIGEVSRLPGEHDADSSYAPELFEDVAATPQSDVYALGSCLRDTLTTLVDNDCVNMWSGYESMIGLAECMTGHHPDHRLNMGTVVTELEMECYQIVNAYD